MNRSWIDTYISYTQNMGSPALFCKWTAIATVAGALERKVWITTSRGTLYPNLYTILVGEPGVGKTLQVDLSWQLWEHLSGEGSDTHRVSAQSVTHASLVDELAKAERKIIRPQDKETPITTFNSLLISVNELPVLLPIYDTAMMAKLTDLYDCKAFDEVRRSKDIDIRMRNVQLNLIAGTTPSQLQNLLPEGAWDQGFLSRTLLIYSGELIKYDLWSSAKVDEKLWKKLCDDLEKIGQIFGPMSFEREAAEAINQWQLSGGQPKPNHPKLAHYCSRRTAHLLKLCMAVSASYSPERIITMEHYGEALNYLLEAESAMSDIFKAMNSGGDGQLIKDAWHFTYEIFMRNKGKEPVRRSLLIHFLSERTTAHNIERIIDIMVQANILREEQVNKVGTCYTPKERQYF